MGFIRVYLLSIFELLWLINGQAGAGNAELEDEDEKEDDHVEKQHDLMVSHGSDQAHDADHEQEGTAGRDPANDGQRVHDGRGLAIRGNPNQDE